MKQFLLIIFIVTIAISIILIGPACSKKTDSADINSTEANTNGIEFSEIKAPIENKIAYLNNIAVIYYKKEDFHEALKIFKIAQYMSRNLNNLKSKNIILNNIGSCHYHLKNYTEALDFLNNAYNNIKNNNKSEDKLWCLNKIGDIYEYITWQAENG